MRRLRTAAAMVALLVIALGYLVVQGVKAERNRASQQASTQETTSRLTLPMGRGSAAQQRLVVVTPSGTETHSPESGEVVDATADGSSPAAISSQTAAPSLVGALPTLPPHAAPSQQAFNNSASGGVGGGHGRSASGNHAPSMSGGGGGGGVGGGSRSGETSTGTGTGRPEMLGKKFSEGSNESNVAAPNANNGSNGSNGGSNDRNGDGNGNNGKNSNGSNDRNGDQNGNGGKNADKGSNGATGGNGGNGSNGGNGGNGSNAGNGGTNHDNASNDGGAPPSNTDGIKGSTAGLTDERVNGGSDRAGANTVKNESTREVPEPGSILVGLGAIAALARRRAR